MATIYRQSQKICQQRDYTYQCKLQLDKILYRTYKLRDSCELQPDAPDPSRPHRRSSLRSEFVSGMFFTTDGGLLVSAAGDSLQMYDPNRGRLLHELRDAMNSPVTNITHAGDSKILSAAASGDISIFDIRSFKGPLSSFRAHTQQVTNILYEPELEWIISSDASGQVTYWYLPACYNGVPDPDHKGNLFMCPNLTRLSMKTDCGYSKLVMTSNTTMFTIHNLKVDKLQQDLQAVQFDENLRFRMVMFASHTTKHSRNKIQTLDLSDYISSPGSTISEVSCLKLDPTCPVVLFRATTKKLDWFTLEKTKDSLSCVKLTSNGKSTRGGDMFCLRRFGADIISESFLYTIEEPHFASRRKKLFGLSKCGRVIASPSKHGIRLLAYSPELSPIDLSLVQKTTISDIDSLWATGPKELHVINEIEMSVHCLCCEFSPDGTLLASGSVQGAVSFHQPTL